MRRDWYGKDIHELNAIHELYIEVKSSGFHALYSTEWDVQWKWNYLYGEEIPATFFSLKERTNYFKNKVEASMKIEDSNIGIIGIIGIIGYQGIFIDLNKHDNFNQNKISVGKKYFLVPNANKEMIENRKEK